MGRAVQVLSCRLVTDEASGGGHRLDESNQIAREAGLDPLLGLTHARGTIGRGCPATQCLLWASNFEFSDVGDCET